jgi:signal transduction histidine kinase
VERGTLRGIALFRWGAWALMAVLIALNRDELQHPWVGWLLVAAALAVTIATTLTATTEPQRLMAAPVVLSELTLGALLQFGGGWAYGSDPFSSAHSIGSAWPLAGILTAGAVWGAVRAGLAGGLVGAARVIQPLAAGVSFADIERSQWFSVASTVILYVLAGAVSGHVSDLLRRLERDISAAQARDEVSRTLHDGVLQTLAIIERRAEDPQLARMAREQERDLRGFLFGSGSSAASGGARSLLPTLLAIASRLEDRYEARVTVVVAPDLPTLREARAEMLCGAIGEAMTNAGKHGAATKVHVYLEPETRVSPGGGKARDGVTGSVRDDGCGFDPSSTNEGIGLGQSIRARIEEADGIVEIESRVGGGTEVRLWLPS